MYLQYLYYRCIYNTFNIYSRGLDFFYLDLDPHSFKSAFATKGYNWSERSFFYTTYYIAHVLGISLN